MLIIDEAIAREREKAKEIRENIIDEKNLEPYESYCIAMAAKCAEEHEQLAELLEELKALRNGLKIKCDSLNDALEKGKKVGYNEALDDFANTLKENYDYLPQILSQEAFDKYIDEYAEQLKADRKNRCKG